jgi:hypothetical protein
MALAEVRDAVGCDVEVPLALRKLLHRVLARSYRRPAVGIECTRLDGAERPQSTNSRNDSGG